MSTEQILLRLVKDIEDIKATMATKEDIKHLETKIDKLETKMNKHDSKIDRNFQQIASNSEQLNTLTNSSKKMDKILEILSLRSIEQEGELRNLQK